MPYRIAAHLCGWPEDVVRDRRRVMEIVRSAGYDGVEGLAASSADDLVDRAARAAECSLRLMNVGTIDRSATGRCNAAFGNHSAETRPGRKPFHHIHAGTILETTEDCSRVLALYPRLIGHVHQKDFWTQDPKAGPDRLRPDFWDTSRYCDLTEGSRGFHVGACLRHLERGQLHRRGGRGGGPPAAGHRGRGPRQPAVPSPPGLLNPRHGMFASRVLQRLRTRSSRTWTTGGTANDSIVVVRGDHVDTVMCLLRERSHTVSRSELGGV